MELYLLQTIVKIVTKNGFLYAAIVFVIQILMASEEINEPSLYKWNGERILALLMARRDPCLLLLLSQMNPRCEFQTAKTADADPGKSTVVESQSSLRPFELITERMNRAISHFFLTSTPII